MKKQSESEAKQLGVMWEWDHLRPLGLAEYKFWMRNVMPWGWSIIQAPQEISNAK